MSIYTDYSLLDINTITKITETINNDFNLLGKPYNKVEKYIDSNNIFNFNISFLLDKQEKYNLFKQVEKNYFWVEFLLERFKTTTPLEITTNTIKVDKINFLISDNNDTFIKITDEDLLNGISKIISVDNNDANFTILTLDNDLTPYNLTSTKEYFISLVKLVYLDQKGIQFSMINSDLYKSQIKVKSTIGVIDTIDIFPSPIISTIDLDIYEKPIFKGNRIINSKYYNEPGAYIVSEAYFIDVKTLEINNRIFTFNPKSFISGTDINVNIRMMIFDKNNGLEFSEVIFNDFIPFSEVETEKITSFHVYNNSNNIFILLRIKNKVMISKLDINGVLIDNYYFNTTIDNFTRQTYFVDFDGRGTRDYLLFENQQSEHEGFIIENGNPVLYKWQFDKDKKYTFNLDNFTSSESSKNIPFLNVNFGYKKESQQFVYDNFIMVKTFIYTQPSNGNTNIFTALFYSGTNEEAEAGKLRLRIYANISGQVFFDDIIYNPALNLGYLGYNSFMSGKIDITLTEDNQVINIGLEGYKNNSEASNIFIKLQNVFNMSNPAIVTINRADFNNSIDIGSTKVIEIEPIFNTKKILTVDTNKAVDFDDLSQYRKINITKSDINGANKINLLIDTELDTIDYIEPELVEPPYIPINGFNLLSPYFYMSLSNTYNSEIFIENDNFIFVIPLLLNSQNYTYLYVKTDTNLNILTKEYV